MAIQSSQFEQEYDKEDAMYTFQEAVRAIQLWKSHQLRLLNQDATRTDWIDCLSDNSVLLIQDWAMKFLPRQYRESQGEWFAKKGFSWHITVAIRKTESGMETQAFVHVVEQCNQDSPCVVMLMEHVLATRRKKTPISIMPFIVKTTQGVIMLHTLFWRAKKSVRELASAFNAWTFQIAREEKGHAIDLLQP